MFFILVSLKKLWQSIYSYIYLVLIIVSLKIVLKRFLGSANLFKTSNFYINKVIKVDIIYKNKYFIFVTFQIVMPYLENFDNSKKFIIIYLILYFYKNYLS